MASTVTEEAGTPVDGHLTAQGVVQTLKCGNPECGTVLAQVHVLGLGIVRVLDCPGCRRGTEFENSPRGWTVRMLPRRETRVVTPQPRPQPTMLNGVRVK